MKYPFILEPYKGKSSRYTCPNCGTNHRFSRYIDNEGNHIAEDVGKCDRDNNCGYHYKPKQYFQDNPTDEPREFKPIPDKPELPPFYIPFELFEKSIHYENNNFVKYLESMFDWQDVSNMINRFYIGTSTRYYGSTIFWQMDQEGIIHEGKVILYNSMTGKRVKGDTYYHWVGNHIGVDWEKNSRQQCLFGLHQLNDNKPIAIVESEKTAVIASYFMPQFTWMATGAKGEFKLKKLSVLAGKKVVAFPDLGAYDYWCKKAEELWMIPDLKVSNILERKATEEERKEGLDIADYLLSQNEVKTDLRRMIDNNPNLQTMIDKFDLVEIPTQISL